jgi:hypothetical protein
MRIKDCDMSSDSDRTAIDRHAVTAAGQLLMSAIWLEHRARQFSTRLSTLQSQRGFVVSVVTSLVAPQSNHMRRLAPDGQGDELTTRKVRPQ